MRSAFRHTLSILLLGAACALPAGAAAIVPQHTPDNVAELKREIADIVRETHVPAVGVALVTQGEVEWVGSLGVADVATGRPADAGTLFRIGSITKGFVALAALKLQEEGRLHLDDTLRQWAPGIALRNRWEATHPVRLENLLEHTAGLDDISVREYASTAAPMPLGSALALYPERRATRWAPGARYAYTNMGPALAAYAIEQASGQRFEDYVRRQFFVPLHMDTATFFRPDNDRFAGQYLADGRTRLPYWDILYRPAGAINASPRDMLRYLQFLLARGRTGGPGGVQLLQPASIARMERCATLPMCRQGVRAGYGLHAFSMMESGLRFVGHDGAVPGALAYLAYLPEHDSGYALMVNSQNGLAALRIHKLLQRYVAHRVAPQQALAPPAAGMPPAPADRERFGGYYRGASPRVERLHGLTWLADLVDVSFTDRGVSTRSILSRRHDDWVLLPGRLLRRPKDPEPVAALIVDEQGRPGLQSMAGTYEKVSSFGAIAPLALAIGCLLLVASSPLFALVWGVRKLAGRLPATEPLRVRVLPLLASLAFIANVAVLALAGAGRDPLPRLGAPTAWSVSIHACGIAFALLAAASLATVWRARRVPMHRGAWWHAALVAAACAAAAIYLAAWGLLGVPTWRM